MRLAVGLRRNSRWPKKNVSPKKKILATKAEVSGFRVDFNVSWYREVLHFAPGRSLFLCVNRVTVFELIILVPIMVREL